MKKRLWLKLFINVAVIFAVFVIVIAIANSSLLSKYFLFKEETLLIENCRSLSTLSLDDSDEVTERINELADKYNFDIEIYEKSGKILYTTVGSQMMDYIHSGFNRPGFSMNHEPLQSTERKITEDGFTVETAVSRPSGKEFLLCKSEADGIITELRIQTDIINNSAYIAGEFITIIAAACLVLSLVWIFIFSRRFTKPIAEMSNVTKKMAKLDFSKKVDVKSSDEIGQLGSSINDMSLTLDNTLRELRLANEKLTDEIELERRLDVMRRAFVANVSHELKTPLSIIGGYAEGLKLNINSASRDSYCDTIIDETERMNRLVQSILELSKYESGQIPFENTEFDIKALCDDMARRILKTRSDIAFENHIRENILVFADKTQTEQILKSYLENALSHTSENGKIALSAEESGDKVKIIVFNTGEQIDPKIMPDIWQSFWRADKSHSREEGRFGLGLSIVRAIVKNAGCSCGVYNTADGVAFWFTVNKKPKD